MIYAIAYAVAMVLAYKWGHRDGKIRGAKDFANIMADLKVSVLRKPMESTEVLEHRTQEVVNAIKGLSHGEVVVHCELDQK